jgi:hypothetical protein
VKKHKRTVAVQLDLFGQSDKPGAEPIHGTQVQLSTPCERCRDWIAVVGPGKPPHRAEIVCASCGTHRQWASNEVHQFISSAITTFGRLAEPVIVRSRSTAPIATATASQQE